MFVSVDLTLEVPVMVIFPVLETVWVGTGSEGATHEPLTHIPEKQSPFDWQETPTPLLQSPLAEHNSLALQLLCELHLPVHVEDPLTESAIITMITMTIMTTPKLEHTNIKSSLIYWSLIKWIS